MVYGCIRLQPYSTFIHHLFIISNFSTMKQVVLIMLCLVLGAGAVQARGFDYVVSEGNVYAFETVKSVSFSGIVGISEEGKQRFPASVVDGYCKDGKIFHKMNDISNGKPTNRKVYMEAVAARNGLTLYRQVQYFNSREKVEIYHIFKGSEYHLTLEPRNSEGMLSFFSRK
jgi:hypothetical protein